MSSAILPRPVHSRRQPPARGARPGAAIDDAVERRAAGRLAGRSVHACLLGLLLVFASPALRLACAAEDPATKAIVAFDAANKLYEQGKFPEAARGYEDLIAAGHGSATLHFNLGNAWFKAGLHGRAIAAYRQAERLAPRDPNIRFNLDFARRRVSSTDAPSGPWLERLASALTVNEWAVFAAVTWWLSFLLLAAGEARETARATARRWAAVTALVTAAAGAGTALAAQLWFHPDAAVVTVAQAIVRSGPLEEARVLHQFRDGTEVRVTDRKSAPGADSSQGWSQVRNAAGQSGWVKDDQLTRIR